MSCTWVSEKLSCTTDLGFEFPNTVTDRLVFKVPRATLEHNGTYECHLQDYQSENIQSCNFIVMPGIVPSLNAYNLNENAKQRIYAVCSVYISSEIIYFDKITKTSSNYCVILNPNMYYYC